MSNATNQKTLDVRGYSVTKNMTTAQYNSDDLRIFGFHFGQGSHVKIWAVSQKHAIERFRGMNPDVVFMTDEEWSKRQIKREKNVAA